jgi:hypothetical protein
MFRIVAPTNKARVASWVIILENDENDPVRAVRSDRIELAFDKIVESDARRLTVRSGGTTRDSREYFWFKFEFVLTSDREDADAPP